MRQPNTLSKLGLERAKAFLKQIQRLAWLELFEKWFGLGVRLLWISLFVAFSIYLRKEYRKDIFYIQDFKVPPTWSEQGYSGDVVKQAIIDEIDKVVNTVYSNDKSIKAANEDGTELLSDFSIEGFNLKAVTRSIMAILGKKSKHIGGYVTMNDSTQTVAIQVTDQITQPVSIKRGEPAQRLIHKATLEVMKFKSPRLLIAYYMTKNDTTMVRAAYNHLLKHRELAKDHVFYDIAIRVALYERKFDIASAWLDSLGTKFPNDKLFFYDKATIHATLAYYTKSDSLAANKNKFLCVENLRKVKEPSRTNEMDANIDNAANEMLLQITYTDKDYKAFIDIMNEMNNKSALNASQYNLLGYAYIGQKDYKKAEEHIKKAVFMASYDGNYWDSLAELYSLQHKDSLSVVHLAIALKSPQRSEAVSVQAYQKDTRWDRLRERADFQTVVGLSAKKTP